ncbi:uncharacterized protein [Palaemon carinicauda]|uniref:uncharacterized protein n=1 Tax=Palaemon carinicauda TaxID=392227 RepID=UPI0035B596FD
MFQRTLILAAISAAFASGIPPQISPCDLITYELQTALSHQDPHTFSNFFNFIYIRDHISYTFDFSNPTLQGFSNVSCTSFHDFEGDRVATLNLKVHNLEFDASEVIIEQQSTNFTTQLNGYTLVLRFRYDNYIPYPLNLCIKRDSLGMTFYAEKITTHVVFSSNVTRELNDHPKEVVEAINLYLPRFANNFTTTLNNILCKPIPTPTTAILTSTPENRRTSARAAPAPTISFQPPSLPNTTPSRIPFGIPDYP